MTASSFKSAGYPWRLFCGPKVIEGNLKAAVVRADAARAMVVCSPSIQAKTDLIARIADSLGGLYAGTFDGVEKDSTYASVMAGVAQARDLNADILIAIGGGSVLVAARAMSIFLSESGDPFELMTQYPKDGRPVSPRLNAPKVPIINIPTTPTSAMNRAGTGLKNPDLDHRMEFFDPKTRPQAIFIDDGALMTAPDGLMRSTATTVFAWAVGATSLPPGNPLSDGDQAQAFRLAHGAYIRMADTMDGPTLRRDLCLAAFLQNRAEDDGQPMVIRGPLASDYAVATALHLQYPSLKQGEATSVIHGATIRLARAVPLSQAQGTAQALGVWKNGMAGGDAVEAIATALERIYAGNAMPVRLRDLEIDQKDFPKIAERTVKIFNASADLTTPESRIERSLQILNEAWA